ncbi:MAG TPA: UrcA family protein [Steroidobacteraceae bacterium]
MTHSAFNANIARVLAVCTVVLAAGALAAPAALAASTPTDPPSVVVRYGDLDLSSEHGALVLYRRLESAARMLCPQPVMGDLGGLARSRACQNELIARAVRTVDNPRLAAVQSAHSSGSARSSRS